MEASKATKREDKIDFAIGITVFLLIIAAAIAISVLVVHYAHRNAPAKLPITTPAPLTKVTLTAPDVTVTYGDEVPELVCLMDSQADFSATAHVNADKLDVGVYDIDIETDADPSRYEVTVVKGKLTVLPKQLAVNEPFVKEYDGGCTFAPRQIRLSGICEGDDVSAQCELLYFDNKNVGRDKNVMLSNVQLVGEDAANYVLPDYARGSIVPKTVRFDGLKVADKLYDGTTRATVEDTGSLVGICEGDSVAIGNVMSRFDSAEAGKQCATVEVTLVGADKDNYTVLPVKCEAEIREKTSFWDKILHKEPITPTDDAR